MILGRKCVPTDEEILEKYKDMKNISLGKLAFILDISEPRCKRVLMQNGLIPNPYAEQIGALMEEGKTHAQIGKELGFSKQKVGVYAPKPIRKSYKTDLTANALRIAKYVAKKKMLCEIKTEELSFAEQLQKEIVRIGITEHKLAERIGVSNKKMRQWLSGESEPDVFTQRAVLEKTKRMRSQA